jgi:hypothetical protein
VQRGKHQVSGLCGFERDFDGLFVAHLAYQSDLGRLPQRCSQSQGKAGSS